ncbi:MAG: NUDIX domain-containing protein [Bacillota bacterium]|nr:NUDIX domain-containing protein [Bacillota bacterium]
MLNVVCGICIIDEKVMIARRSYGSSKGWYEFPGGKVEIGESLEQALIREWKEECGINIQIIKPFMTSYDDTQGKETIQLSSFICTSDRKPKKYDSHDEYIWTEPINIYNHHFFEADRVLVEKLIKEWDVLMSQIKQKG